MRDRLIELLQKADKRCDDTKQCEDCIGFGKGSECVNYNIADYLLANGVIVPPCKVGQTVYKIVKDEILHYKVTSITIEHLPAYRYKIATSGIGYLFLHADYSRNDRYSDSYYLTPEEAEKALAERSENEHKTGNK